MQQFLDISIQIFGALLAAVLAAGQLFLRNKKAVNYFYALTFISIAVWSGIYAAAEFPASDNLTGRALLDIIAKTAYSLTGVFLYFLLQSIFNSESLARWKNLLFFAPALMTMPVLILSYLSLGSLYPAIKAVISSALYIFSIFVYGLIIYQVTMLRRQSDNSGSRRKILWIIIFLAVAAILTIIPQLAPVTVSDSCSVPVLTVLFYIITMRYPEVFNLLREEAEKARYSRSKIGSLDIFRVKSILESLLKEQKLFLESSLTLGDLASHAGITTHQLSEILNVYYRKNFYDFINAYRIEEAKRIFSEDRSATAIGICFQVGFNSNSAFYRAFKKETGSSPAKFRRDKL